MAQPYKHPKSGIYQLRRKVPLELREVLNLTEYKVSLKTREPSEVPARFAAALVACERVFALARAQLKGEATYDREDAQQLASRWLRAEQERMDEMGEFTGALAQDSTTWVETSDGVEEVLSFDALRAVANSDEAVDLRAVAQKALEGALRHERLPVPSRGSTAYQGLANAFEEHLDKLSEWALQRHNGELVSRGIGVAPFAPIKAEKRAEAAAKPKVHTLRDLFVEYSKEKALNAGGRVKRDGSKTLKTYKALVDDFIDFHGNLDVRAIDRHLIAQHREQIARLPAKGMCSTKLGLT